MLCSTLRAKVVLVFYFSKSVLGPYHVLAVPYHSQLQGLWAGILLREMWEAEGRCSWSLVFQDSRLADFTCLPKLTCNPRTHP
jgi:hypothetical protein